MMKGRIKAGLGWFGNHGMLIIRNLVLESGLGLCTSYRGPACSARQSVWMGRGLLWLLPRMCEGLSFRGNL